MKLSNPFSNLLSIFVVFIIIYGGMSVGGVIAAVAAFYLFDGSEQIATATFYAVSLYIGMYLLLWYDKI